MTNRQQRRQHARTTATGAQRLLVEAVRLHQRGRLDKATALYQRILRADPRHPDALHLSGLVAHQRGDHRQARASIDAAIAIDADRAAFHNSLGAVYLALGQPEQAEACLRRALELDPGSAETHNNLGNALQRTGRLHEAVAAYRRALQLRQDYAEAHYNQGRAWHGLDDLAAAAACYRRAVAIRPGYAKALKGLGDVLAEQGRSDDAAAEYRSALAADPADAETHAALAALWERASELPQALAKAEETLRLDSGNVRATVVAARCERRLGRPADGLARLRRLATGRLEDDARAHLMYETATILDRIGDYPDAYEAYVVANRLNARNPQAARIDRGAYPALIERLRARFTPDWVRSWTPAIADAPPPVFLVGFPRSGTTLLDQILDAHSALQTMEEKPAIDVVRQAVEHLPGGYPDALAAMTPDDVAGLRRLYFDEVARCMGGPPSATLVDKMPLNTIDVGLIHRLFPDARILLALRHPCDVVLSGFMQPFKPNAAMVHFGDLGDTARFYAAVMSLWQRYGEVLPLTVLATRYEDLVADFEAETRRILTFLGLPWEESLRGYAERARSRPIATPSYHQVVQPIYTRSVGRWINYREPMAAVLPVLAPFIDAFGYRADVDPD
ncbi:MAG: sulfotransferase [Rhodospirillales bacterium]